MAKYTSRVRRKEGDDNMTTTFGEPIRPNANIGDIITVKGYGIRTFRVDAFTYEMSIDSENSFEEIYYDVTCVTTFEHILASQDDIAVVSRSKDAPQYLRAHVTRPQTTAHIPTTDELLDELSDAMTLEELFGELGDRGGASAYALRVDEIKAKLRQKVATEQWT